MSKFNMDTFDSGAKKHTDNKPRIDLVPPESILLDADVYTYGAVVKGYGDRNWESGIPYMTNYAAALRHILAWAQGIDSDDESGLPHLAHARVNLAMILTQQARGRTDLDDRAIRKD